MTLMTHYDAIVIGAGQAGGPLHCFHYTVLRDGVFAHPTLAESLNNLFSTID
jgi:hypothetical protein